LVKKAIIHLENGKSLTIIANNQSEENVFVRSVSLNGKTLEGTTISHNDMMLGGELVFEMSSKPH